MMSVWKINTTISGSRCSGFSTPNGVSAKNSPTPTYAGTERRKVERGTVVYVSEFLKNLRLGMFVDSLGARSFELSRAIIKDSWGFCGVEVHGRRTNAALCNASASGSASARKTRFMDA